MIRSPMRTVELSYTAPPERIAAGLRDNMGTLNAYAAAERLAEELVGCQKSAQQL